MAQKKATPQKGRTNATAGRPQQKGAQQKKKPIYHEEPPRAEKKERGLFASLVPYLLIVLALILGICFVTVSLLEMDDGVGVLGNAIQVLTRGLLGGAAFLLPAGLCIVGVLWILLHLRERDVENGSEDAESLERMRKRTVLNTVFIGVTLLLVGILLGVFSETCESLEIAYMWEDGAENLVSGGVLGGFFAWLLVTCFKRVISIILLVLAIALLVILTIGLTPDRIVYLVREKKREREALRLEEEAELLAQQQAEQREARKHANRLATVAAEEAVERRAGKKASMSVDDMIEDDEDDEEEEETEQPAAEVKPATDEHIYIGPSREQQDRTVIVPKTVDPAVDDQTVGKDYGGDPDFDGAEYDDLSGVIDDALAVGTASGTLTVENEADAVDMSDVTIGEMTADELQEDMSAVAPATDEEEIPEVEMPYVFPPVDMLTMNPHTEQNDYSEELQENAKRLVETLKSFRIGIREITYSRGPTITRYELKPDAGIRVRSIANLVDDIALNLASSGVRIEAPIPNKPAVGIEVPNRERATVYLRDLIESPKFSEAKSRLTACLGMDVGGNPIYFDIAKMPHLLIAGATGMGKSVCINCVVVSLLYKAKPSELKLIMIDPKKVEFNIYKDIPHLYAPIVSDPKKAAGALASAVAEMERRFELIEMEGVRDIGGYNAAIEGDPTKEYMPHMVIIIDELADLMMTAPDEVESCICRLAQKARAAGIHIIIGTQRPSVDVITGLIKANVPSRIACTVASQVDSRTILDIAGAEKLIGRGDMLFAPVGASKPMRVQGAFVGEGEIEKIISFIKANNSQAKFNEAFISRLEEEAAKCGTGKKGASAAAPAESSGDDEGGDSKFRDAVKLAIEEGKISTSLMQRRLGVGYGRAAKIIDTMEEYGYVSKPDGNKPRRVLITMEEYNRRIVDNDLGGED